MDWDLVNKNIECSKGLYQILAITNDLQISDYDQFFEFIYPEDKTLVDSFIKDCLENKKTGKLEHRLLTSNHLVKKVYHQLDLQIDNQGNLIHLFGTLHDLTNEFE